MESRLCVWRQCLLLLHDLMIAFLHDMNAVVIKGDKIMAAKRKDKQLSTQYYIEHERLNNPNLHKE